MSVVPDLEWIALQLWDNDLFLDRAKSPGGEGFKVRRHVTHKDDPLCPFYVDLRSLRAFPRLLEAVGLAYAELVIQRSLNFDLILDIPDAATPIAVHLQRITGMPMISPAKPKEYGISRKFLGRYKADQKVAVVDDTITDGGSKLGIYPSLAEEGLICEDTFVLIDRQQGGDLRLAEVGQRLWSVFAIRPLLDLWEETGRLTPDSSFEIRDYLVKNQYSRCA